MRRVPNSRGVQKSLKATVKAVKAALKDLNRTAGQVMARGDYEGAQAMAQRGREIQAFLCEVEALLGRWRGLGGGGGTPGKKAATPLWAYYKPILQALERAGGSARRTALEPAVREFMQAAFQTGDADPMRKGRERWQVMIQRAKKHLIAEGWIEKNGGPVWKVTESGRVAAKAPAQRSA